MVKNKKTVTVSPDLFITIIETDFYFTVQKAFQDLGVTFIDLNNGHVITGQINIDTLGMIRGYKPSNGKQPENELSSHFLLPPKDQKEPTFDVEATINIYEPKESSETIFTIQVININELSDWYNLAAQVGAQFIKLDEFENKVPAATFRIVPLTVPDPQNPNSSAQAMRNNIQRYSASNSSFYAVSDQSIYPYEDDLEEDIP